MKVAVDTLRLGTLNVATLAGRVATIIALCVTLGLDILALQETRVPQHSRASVEAAFAKAGWHCTLGPSAVSADGKPLYGTAIVSRVPVVPFALPATLLPQGRGCGVRVHRAVGRPVLCTNLYLPASSETQAAAHLRDVFSFLASTGEECVLLGDYNLTAQHAPLSEVRALGTWRLADEVVLGDCVMPPTRRDKHGQPCGRCVDFALSTVGLPALARQQNRGPADHDLVSYDFSFARDLRSVPRAPGRLPLASTVEAVSVESWNECWAPCSEAFAEALQQGDLDHAWTLLSDAAEDLLLDPERPAGGAARRSMVLEPKPRPPQSTKAPTVQTHKERSLRRLARRATELSRSPDSPDAAVLQRKLRASAAALGLSFHGDLPRLVAEALEAAAALEASSVAFRVANWHKSLQSDSRRMRQWIQRVPAADPRPLGDDPVHPLDIASQEHGKWKQQWTRAPVHSAVETWRWCLAHGPPAPAWTEDDLHPSAQALQACVRASARRAAGLDGWTPQHLARLPLDFYELLARLWASCLSRASLPQAWCKVRVALLAKPDGGRRPLSVASALWRVLATVVVRKRRCWTLTWAPDELLGSIPGRSVADLHATFACDAHRARTNRLPMAGHKADVQKCFDSVSFDQAFEVARWLGAPPALLGLLKVFYARQERYIAWQGAFHPTPIAPSMGLLQGCPFSPLLLNGVCSLWVRVVKAAEPRASLAVYLDDRTVWRVGRQASQVVVTAARAGTTFDDFFGLRLHPEKLGSFASTAPEREALQAEALVVGAVKTQFVLLGVPYAFGTTCLPDTAALTSTVKRRCDRVALAATSLPRRRALVQELVLSLFAWAGPWTHFKKADVDAWTRDVAHALWGHKPPLARSRLLLWHVVGRPSHHPAHALDWATARREWLRCSVPDAFRLGAATITPSWPVLQRKWGWTTAQDGSWITPVGILRPGWDGLACLKRAADYAFLQQVWALDPKCCEHDLSLSFPAFGSARRFVEGQDRSVLRTATACAADARLLQRLQHPPSRAQLCCACEEPEPTRTHLTFECPSTPWTLEPGLRCERALLLRLLPLPLPQHVPRPLPEPEVDLEVVEALRQAAATGRVLCASDGGAFSRTQLEWWQRAAWAVAFEGDHSRTVFGGLVAGLDQSPHAAERAGLWQFLRHLRYADVPATLYLDNYALVLRLRRGLRHDKWSGSNPAFWQAVAQVIRRDLVAAWVPSHGKQAKWQALEPQHTARVRALNAAADARCTTALLQYRPEWEAAVTRFERAEAWGAKALSVQHEKCAPFHELLKKCMGEWRIRQGCA